jgi:hypothetical protein
MSGVVTLFGVQELVDIPESGKIVEWVLPKQNIGIEIEVERKTLTRFPNNLYFWDEKSDGSLQNGREYVLKAPLKGNDLAIAISEFFGNSEVQRSATSGTHIHLDMREKTTDMGVVQAMAATICCIEPAIFAMFGEGREWSGYTNKMDTLPQDALGAVFDDESSDRFVQQFRPDSREYKYYGFNMLPLGRFGSVEFRYFPTATNPDELIEWIQFCQTVKAAGVSIGSLASFKQYVQHEVQWEEFLKTYFPQWAERMREHLPYMEVRRRYKAARAVSRTSVPNNGPPRLSAKAQAMPTPASTKSKKFRKFYAMKVKDKEGKFRLAYNKEDVQALRPLTIVGSQIGSHTVLDRSFFYETNCFHQRRSGEGFTTLFYVEGDRADHMRWVEEHELVAFNQAAEVWIQNPEGAHPLYVERMVAALRDYVTKQHVYYENLAMSREQVGQAAPAPYTPNPSLAVRGTITGRATSTPSTRIFQEYNTSSVEQRARAAAVANTAIPRVWLDEVTQAGPSPEEEEQDDVLLQALINNVSTSEGE